MMEVNCTLPVIVVNEVAESWGVHNIQVKTNTILFDI